MFSARKRATRVVVISDLHLGGQGRPMMSRPHLLADFIDGLTQRYPPDPSDTLELVIAGDFVDFLAIEPHASWTPDPVEARAKLVQIADSEPFAVVFDALGRHIAKGHRLTVLLGNHDVELALPSVQDALTRRLKADPHELLFVADGRAYRIGGALIEHGNRYDDANITDHTNLRAIVSAQSRGEDPRQHLRVSAGSQIVTHVVNSLKEKYPWVDLLQPTGELVALLLLALEPGLRWNWGMIGRVLQGAYLEKRNAAGVQPGTTTYVANTQFLTDDSELKTAFGSFYDELRRPAEQVASTAWYPIALAAPGDGVASLFSRGQPIPSTRLQQIRVALRKLLLSDRSDTRTGPLGPYGGAAQRYIAGGVADLVIMGHTHLAREVTFESGGRYINTGTWVDYFRVPTPCLIDSSDPSGDIALTEFLRDLCEDRRNPLPPTFAEFYVTRDGNVESSALREAVT